MTLMSFLYILLSILGLSFLVFIHELGHYFMARRTGMKVETFSIGFGKPIYTWEKDGVRWQIGWLLFGGYVKIAGMDTTDQRNIYDVKDGFFGKSPWDRIKVAFMGPLVNIVFAFLAFLALWMLGGREKKFNEYTHKIGWLDQHSELYAKGVRPGDEITAYNHRLFKSAKDHLTIPMTSDGHVLVSGFKVNGNTMEKKPFEYLVKTYPHPEVLDKDLFTIGVFQPASYLIYRTGNNNKVDSDLPEGSPMRNSGIQDGDNIIWVDGSLVYSVPQLTHIVNENKALLTIQRDGDTFLRRVPRVMVEELKLEPAFKEELSDWQFEAELNNIKLQKLYIIPYNLNNECVVEGVADFIDNDKKNEIFPAHSFSSIEKPLEKGDKILAVDGIEVAHSYEIMMHLQQRHINIIVEHKQTVAHTVTNWKNADERFDHRYSPEDLKRLIVTIGLSNDAHKVGHLELLDAVVPKTRKQFQLDVDNQALAAAELMTQKKEIDEIDDPDKRARVRDLLEAHEKQLLLGLPALQDETVQYNPDPITIFDNVLAEIWYTLKALFTGALNPKWMSGPIGIVHVVHDNSMVSLKEALFWLGAISLNLGIFNLLPLPVLDGGTICFALYEIITGKRLRPRTLEKLIIPFALILIGFFIFLTYHDLTRIFSRWFH